MQIFVIAQFGEVGRTGHGSGSWQELDNTTEANRQSKHIEEEEEGGQILSG